MHGGLRDLAADIGDREHDSGDDRAERMKPAEKGNDDGGEAIARGKAEIELATLGRRFQNAGEPRHSARYQQRPPDHVVRVVARIFRRLGRFADDANPKPNSERDITIQNTMLNANAMNRPGGNGVPHSILRQRIARR